MTKTEGYEVRQLEKLYALLCQTIYRHRRDYDKTALIQVGTKLTSEAINAQYNLLPCFSNCAHHFCFTPSLWRVSLLSGLNVALGWFPTLHERQTNVFDSCNGEQKNKANTF